jgi:hypothetical protein
MDARAEQTSLREDPLPPVVILNPLTRVWNIDGQIAALQEQINDLQQQRTEALDYAIREQIAEDENCRLDRKVRRIRSLDPVRFREVFPEEFRMACDLERKEKTEALEHIGEKITLGLADKLVKKVVLDAAQGVISVKESESLSVVRK